MPEHHNTNPETNPQANPPATGPTAPRASTATTTKARRTTSRKTTRTPRRIIIVRAIVISAVLLPILAVAAFRLLANAPILERLLREQAQQRLGCEFHTTGVRIDWLGRLVIEQPRLTIPTLTGPAAEILSAPKAVVHLDWSSILTDAPRPTLVRIDDATLRISQETDTGVINLALVGPPESQDRISPHTPRPPRQPTTKPEPSTLRPPRIDLRSATLELGEHNNTGDYATLASLTVRGLLAPEPDAPEKFTVKLQRVPPQLSEFASRQSTDAPGDPLAYLADHRLTILSGELDVVESTARLELLNVDLAEWGPEQTPTSVRELWAQLNVRGSIPRTEFRYTPSAGVIVTVTLADVTMNTPVQADTPADKDEDNDTTSLNTPSAVDYLSLSKVSGTLTFSREGLDARVQGLVEDLPCQVNLQTTGLGVNAPLRCEIISERFIVGDEPELMPYVPRLVRRRFADFSGPTATVDARVLLTRGEPTGNQPAELTTEGTIRVENGRAAFENFPYPGIELSGLVRFTDESIDILNVQGRGLRGGIISGQATIAPLTSASRVNVEVLALDIPVDDILRDAIPSGRGRILDQLLSQSQYNKLLELGLVHSASPNTATATQDPQYPDAPPFAFGGVISQLEILVRREPINDGEWSWSANVDLPRLGLVPEGFPLPIEATDVRLELGDTHARLIGGRFRGAGGGNAQIDVDVTIGDQENNNAFDAVITVASDNMPIDARLIHALPDAQRVSRKKIEPQVGAAPDQTTPSSETTQEDPARLSIHRLLTQLRPQGTMGVNATVRLHDEPGKDSVLFDVTADLTDVNARPLGPSQDSGLHITNITGRVYADNNQLQINNLQGQLQQHSNHIADLTLDAVLQGITNDQSHIQQQPSDEPSTSINLLASNLRVEAPFEHLLAIFSSPAAEAVASIRSRHHVAGLVNADIHAFSINTTTPNPQQPDNTTNDDDIAVNVELSGLTDIRLSAYDTDLSIPTSTGLVRIQQSPNTKGPILEFHNFTTSIHPGTEPPVGIALDGQLQLNNQESTISAEAGRLNINLTSARFESTMLAKVLTALAPQQSSSQLLALQPTGRFDADILADLGPITPTPTTQPSDNTNTAVTLSIRPSDLAFTLDEQRHRFDRVQGQLSAQIDNAGAVGRIEALHLDQQALRLTIDGPFQYHNDTGFDLRTSITMSADRYDNTTTAILPQAVRDALDSIGLKSNTPWSITNAWVGYTGHLKANTQPADKPASPTSISTQTPGTAFVGLVAFEQLTADIGLPIHARAATARVDARRSPNAPNLDLAIDLKAERLTVAGVPMTNGHARIVSASAPGSIAIPQASADCEGGRVSMNALLRTQPNNPAATGSWTLNVQVAGARLVPVLESIRATNAGKNNENAEQSQPQHVTHTGPTYPTPQATSSTADDRRRGYLDATLSLAGTIDRPQARTGRGSIRVSGGDVVSLPLILNLVELTSLQLPVGDKLDYLDTTFHVLGNTWSFDQISLVSDTMSILGSGSMTTPDNILDLRFAARSRLRVPVITDLVEGVRDELATITVTGPVDDPSFNVEQLSATRMFLDSILSPTQRDNNQTPAQSTDRESRSERDRLRGRR